MAWLAAKAALVGERPVPASIGELPPGSMQAIYQRAPADPICMGDARLMPVVLEALGKSLPVDKLAPMLKVINH